MEELERLLGVNKMLEPGTQGQNFIKMRCYCDFEGHGRASETWEKHWELILPMVQYHWKSTKGWVPGKKGLKQKFHGRTFTAVVEEAKQFLKALKSKMNER